MEELKKALEDQGVDVNSEEYKNAVSKFNNGETYGAVMGNTIITQDKEQAKKDLDKLAQDPKYKYAMENGIKKEEDD